MTDKKITSGNTGANSKGIDAPAAGEDTVYFHPGSGTVLIVPAKDNKNLEAEQNLLSRLMEEKIAAQINVEEVTKQCLAYSRTDKNRAQTQLQAAYDKLNLAAEKLRNELKNLTPNVKEGELLDESAKESAVGMMELIPMTKRGAHGFKMTYVRSDKIKSTFRRYKLSSVDNKGNEDSFLKSNTRQVTNSNGETKEKTYYTIDTEKLKKQFDEVDKSLKADLSGGALEKYDTNLIIGEWAQEFNKSISDKLKDINFDDNNVAGVSLDSQAQLMRFSSGVGTEGEFNPRDKKVSAKGKAHAGFVLAEAKAEFKSYFPDSVGFELTYPKRKILPTDSEEGSLGFIKAALTLAVSGNVGASIGIEAGINLDWSTATAQSYGIRGSNQKLKVNQLPGLRNTNLSIPATPDGELGGELGAFAGLQAGGSIAGALQWKSPEYQPEEGQDDDGYKDFAKIEPKLQVQAGAGGTGHFYITFINMKFRIYVKAGLCWGVGAKGSIGFEVDANQLLSFFEMFIIALRNADYKKLLCMIEFEAFQTLANMQILYAQAKKTITEIANMSLEELGVEAFQALKGAEDRVILMESILNNPDKLKYSTPEAKGAIIASLIDINMIDKNDFRNENWNFLEANAWKRGKMNKRKRAVFKSMKWIQSKAEYRNVLQHMSTTVTEKKTNWEDQQRKLINFLSMNEDGGIFNLPHTNYGEKIQQLYDELPESVPANEPLKPIPDARMDEFLAMVDNEKMTAYA
ncbi:hypothetical protein ABRZ24_20005 [Brenneria populi]|uniref:ATPase n=1 Tax=Brenneria populi TaxID=1505588 RepID=A0ABU6JX73_9GAMM|nr:hypothetical protein [Brenneria populi Li et al. 2015]